MHFDMRRLFNVFYLDTISFSFNSIAILYLLLLFEMNTVLTLLIFGA